MHKQTVSVTVKIKFAAVHFRKTHGAVLLGIKAYNKHAVKADIRGKGYIMHLCHFMTESYVKIIFRINNACFYVLPPPLLLQAVLKHDRSS